MADAPPDLSAPAIRLYLALLLSPRPVSMAQCGAWGLADFGEQLRLLSEAVERGWLREATQGPSGRFAWRQPRDAEALFERAESEDWIAVLEALDFARWGPDAAREAAQQGDLDRARVLYRALLVGLRAAPERSTAAQWLDLVMEALRLLRREVRWLSASLQQDAYEQAVQLGDSRAEAVLLATRAYEQLRGGQAGEAEAWCDRALEIAAGLDDAETRQHILLYVANNWILLGRLPEALSMLESFVGDVPPELLPPQSTSQTPDTLTEASLATLANVYGWTGSDDRALDLLQRMVEVGTSADQPLLAKMAKVYLAWFYADRGQIEPAERWGQAALDALEPDDVYLWFASQPMAWVWMRRGRADRARAQLEAGHRSRLAVGHTHFQNSYVLDVLAWLDEQPVEAIEGMTLEGEIERLLTSPDMRMRAVAHRFCARQQSDRAHTAGERSTVDDHLSESLRLLHASGAVVEQLRTLRVAAAWAQRQGRTEQAEGLRVELCEAEQLGAGDDPAPASGHLRQSHVARAIIDMGRLTLLSHRREGFFGDVVARICRELAVERCALFDSTSELRLLAARGGDRDWLAALGSLLGSVAASAVQVLAPPGTDGDGAAEQLVLIPYRIDDLGRRGWLCLENRRRQALVAAADQALLESLGVQMGVLIGNVELWEELRAVRQRLERENRYYREASPAPVAAGQMVGESAAFRRMFELIAKIAPTGSAALILGETGVGKELVARELHRLSAQRSGPFIVAHVASMPSGLVASALFGHERGAFTGATEQVRGRFELAHGGTLFLDEIGELGPDDQVRLLRVLQEGTFERLGGARTIRSDFRLVAATNRDLDAMVSDGRFREDLYYRLNVFPVQVPPLRERRDDIPRLALHFLDRFARRTGRGFEGIGQADVDRLLGYPWPGNVRELEHVIERAVVLSQPPMLKIPSLETKATEHGRAQRAGQGWVTLAEQERAYVRQVLLHCRGRITGQGGAAEILGLKPTTLQSRIDKLGLRDELGQARATSKH